MFDVGRHDTGCDEDDVAGGKKQKVQTVMISSSEASLATFSTGVLQGRSSISGSADLLRQDCDTLTGSSAALTFQPPRTPSGT